MSYKFDNVFSNDCAGCVRKLPKIDDGRMQA